MSDIAIKAENVSKLYHIGNNNSFRDLIMSPLRRIKGEKAYNFQELWALKDISFEIKKGETVGFIGKNGAGKSTLLKILSRITEPTKGYIEMDGRVASLLEVGTGFHPELSGRENIYLNGTILGMKKAEIKARFDEIVEFSGIAKFLDTPVKRYSSGMYVRLAFAVAAHLESEILIIDEVLAVGDAEFQKKCLGKMGDIANKEGRTVLFVSHNMAAAKKLCEKGIYLKEGKLLVHSTIDDAINQYLSLGDNVNDFYKDKINYDLFSEDIHITNLNFELNEDDAILNLELSVHKVQENIGIMIAFYDTSENLIFKTSTNPIWSDRLFTIENNKKISVHFSDFNLTGGEYFIGVAVTIPGINYLMKINRAKKIELPKRTIYDGKINLDYPGNGYCMIKHKWII